MRILVVGSGLAGSVSARLFKDKGYDVKILETNYHIGGNCYDYWIDNICVHKYGPHTFHTNNKNIWDFFCRFSHLVPYCHEVRANTKLGNIPVPFNKESEQILGLKTPEQITDLIFKPYSQKMWGEKWENLPKTITNRVPKIRDSFSPCYHDSLYQGIPVNGYTEFFENILDGIQVELACDKNQWKKEKWDILVWTGKVDQFFDFEYGELGYRSLQIRFWGGEDRQNCLQTNECNDKPYTRTIDHSYWYDRLNGGKTIISREYPCEHNQWNTPFYPKNFGIDLDNARKYAKLIKSQRSVYFLGRLANYQYLDMDQVIGQVLNKLSVL